MCFSLITQSQFPSLLGKSVKGTPQKMEFDPYSTACIEPKAFTFGKENHSEAGKRVEFFSKIGRKRLQRIWNDNRLSDEVLFTGLDKSESVGRETVSDYVQHYLIKRMRRLSLGRKLSKSKNELGSFQTRKMFQVYEDFITDKHRKRDEKRMIQEVERITKLLISGRVKYAPVDLQHLYEDPIFKINRLMDSVRNLEFEEIFVEAIPFEIETREITNVGESSNNNVNSSNERVIESNNDLEKNNFASESDLFSISSNLTDAVEQSPFSSRISALSALSKKAYFVEFPVSEQEKARSFSIISELTDEELCHFAEKKFEHEEISGELEIEEVFSINEDTRGPLNLVKEQNSCDLMYRMAFDIVNMYQRQQAVGHEFMEEFSSLYFNK